MTFQLPTRPRATRKKWYAAVIPDVHVGYVVDTPTYSLGAWDLTIQALRHDAKRLTHVVILGDFGNWESLSHWASLRADQPFVEEDVALVNARLDEIEAITKPAGITVVFCEGNHEAWASQLEAKYPALRDVVSLARRLHFKRRGWLWVPENHFYQLGDLHFTHGHVKGVKSPRDMIRRAGVSVCYGHTHTYETQSVRTLKGEHAAWTLGCLASIEPAPPYARGEHPSSWVHGFGRVQVRSSGHFQLGFRRIIEESWTELEDGTELRVDLAACRRRLDEDEAVRQALRAEYQTRYYVPGGRVLRTEPLLGGTENRARRGRARMVRGMVGA